MYAICEYHIPIIDEFSLPLHKKDRILSVTHYDGKPSLNVLVDRSLRLVNKKLYSEKPSMRHFRLVQTNELLTDKEIGGPTEDHSLNYIASFQLGILSFHLFEKVTFE